MFWGLAHLEDLPSTLSDRPRRVFYGELSRALQFTRTENKSGLPPFRLKMPLLLWEEPAILPCLYGGRHAALPTCLGKSALLVETQHQNKFLQISPNPLRRLWNCPSECIIVLICCFLYPVLVAAKAVGSLRTSPWGLLSCLGLFSQAPHFEADATHFKKNFFLIVSSFLKFSILSIYDFTHRG